MGEDVTATVFSREDRQRYRQKVKRCLDVFARMLGEARFDAEPGYHLTKEQISAARGEDLAIAITGVERLSTYADTMAPEAACTSVQLHLQVDPTAFGTHWNAAQAIAGVQLALAANSPFFFG